MIAFTAEKKSNSNDPYYLKKEKAIHFLKTKGSCYLAVGLETDFDKSYILPQVLCVMDGIANPGTAREKSGCSLMTIDLNTGVIYGLVQSFPNVPAAYNVADHDCQKGGFEELLKMKPFMVTNNPNKAPNNAWYLTHSGFGFAKPKNKSFEILFSYSDKFTKKFNELNKEGK